MTEGEIAAAAAADPDARPMTRDELEGARRTPRVKTLRRALALTEEEFAFRFHIPLGTLRDWERGAQSRTNRRTRISAPLREMQTRSRELWLRARARLDGRAPRRLTPRPRPD
jgi:DNA-binding transcriptional regulator YiaG